MTGDDLQTQVILGCNALPSLLHLISSSKESIKKEACWTISNITAGNRQQIQVSSLNKHDSLEIGNILNTLIKLVDLSFVLVYY